MQVLWIIGNGFDLNIGLNTTYSSFWKTSYIKNKSLKTDREKLLKAFPDWQQEEELPWSNLELMLGKASDGFDYKTLEDFHGIFERMSEELRKYLINEASLLSEDLISEKDINEFWKSITNFQKRMKPGDINYLGDIRSERENIYHEFVNLNYTFVFDKYLALAKKAKNPFDKRVLAKCSYHDSAGEVLHIHGTVEEEGEMILGVCDAEQIANEEFSKDNSFLELWTKESKNKFCRNQKNEQLAQMISHSRVICIFGSSLGATDSYIWRLIGKWLSNPNNSLARLVVYQHDVPSIGTTAARQLQKKRKSVKDSFAELAKWDNETAEHYSDRIIVLSSKCLFDIHPLEEQPE